MKYNKFERKIGKFLERFPLLRRLIKSTYQKLSYTFYQKRGFKIRLDSQVSIKGILLPLVNKRDEAFFGYYDKTPWSFDKKYYLVHIYNSNNKNEVNIGVYNCEVGTLEFIDKTPAFNFQQGAMLKWLNNNNHYCIYNTVRDDNLVSLIRDAISSKEIEMIPIPIQTVNYEGTEALTLNYKRLYKIRPEYGYKVKVENFYENMDYNKDGIWKINLCSRKSELIIRLSDLISLNYNKTMDASQHKINHIMYSPSGKKFVFMHRWIGNYGKFSRLYTANTDGTQLHCLMDDGVVSHYCWVNDEYLIVWGRKKLFGDKYYLVKDKSSEWNILGNGVIDMYGDGHPSISPNKQWLVIDTYPDKARIRELILFNLNTKQKIIIGEFFAPWKYDGSYRCDLHPRWSPDSMKISIDSVHEGYRNSYIVDISKLVKNE